MNSEMIYNLTPVIVDAPITPGSDLQAPSDCTANLNPNTKILTVTATITLPQGEDLSKVTLEQYYSEENGLQFYYVYNFSTPPRATYVPYSCSFEALTDDQTGAPIPFENINTVLQIIQDIDPKTSRGTSTPITHNTDI
jgi:hypothetical protein